MTVCNNVIVVPHIENNSLFASYGDLMCYIGNGRTMPVVKFKVKQPFRSFDNSFLVESRRCKMFFFHFASTLMLTSQLTEPDDTAKALKEKKTLLAMLGS